MANDRLTFVCQACGDALTFYKWYPSAGGMTKTAENVNEWFAEHMFSPEPRYRPALFNEEELHSREIAIKREALEQLFEDGQSAHHDPAPAEKVQEVVNRIVDDEWINRPTAWDHNPR